MWPLSFLYGTDHCFCAFRRYGSNCELYDDWTMIELKKNEISHSRYGRSLAVEKQFGYQPRPAKTLDVTQESVHELNVDSSSAIGFVTVFWALFLTLMFCFGLNVKNRIKKPRNIRKNWKLAQFV